MHEDLGIEEMSVDDEVEERSPETSRKSKKRREREDGKLCTLFLGKLNNFTSCFVADYDFFFVFLHFLFCLFANILGIFSSLSFLFSSFY